MRREGRLGKLPGWTKPLGQSLGAVAEHKDGNGARKDMGQHLAAIAGLLRAGIGHDFSGYKESTLTRRIQRRMDLLHVDDVPSYVERLKTDRGELQGLFQELLISVTQFFRDPGAFEALKSTALAPVISSKAAGEPIRIWVPGCAKGAEVYSIAILLSECMTDSHRAQSSDIKIFGTDIDDSAIAIARSGSYRQPVTGVSPERLERWFVKEGNAPAYFVVDRQHQILRFSGSKARHYLEPSPGVASHPSAVGRGISGVPPVFCTMIRFRSAGEVELVVGDRQRSPHWAPSRARGTWPWGRRVGRPATRWIC